jgi:hypothetical protein
MRFHILAATVLLASGCAQPAPEPHPEDMEVVNATQVDHAIAPGAFDDDETVEFRGGNVTPADPDEIHEVEPQSANEAAMNFARLLAQRQFQDAFAMWAPEAADFTADHFTSRFDRFETINAAVRRNVEGPAAGPNQQQIQLTLTGRTRDGGNYTLTGPITLARMDDTAETPGRWQVVRLVLTANPRAADQLIDQ